MTSKNKKYILGKSFTINSTAVYRNMDHYLKTNNGRVHLGIEVAVKDGLRGVYANQPIQKNEELLFVPNDMIIFCKASKPEDCLTKMAIQLSKKDPRFKPYFDHLPLSVKDFPAAWKTPVQHPTLGAIAQIRRARMHEDWKASKSTMSFDDFIYWRTIVGSRNFAKNTHEIGMVPFADLMNASAKPNVDWFYTDVGFKMISTKYIDTGDQLYDNYGVKSTVEWLMYYGCVPQKEIAPSDRITYLLSEIKHKKMQNLIPAGLPQGKQPFYEFCIEENHGTGSDEILSLMRFMVSDTPASKCPTSLNGYSFPPVNREQEIKALHAFASILKPPTLTDVSIKSYKDYVDLERHTIQSSLKRVDEAILCLLKTDYRSAKKAIKESKWLGNYKETVYKLCKKSTYT